MKSRKLIELGRRRALSSKLACLNQGEQISVVRPNQIKMALPKWLEALERDNAQPVSPVEAEKELNEFVGAARTIGKGQANIAIALTQVLIESLSGECDIEGIPPICEWSDITAILRAISSAEVGMDAWAQAIGVDKVIEMIEPEFKDGSR